MYFNPITQPADKRTPYIPPLTPILFIVTYPCLDAVSCPVSESSKRRPKQKRKPGRNPRVPFTPKQLTTLENKFETMKYLTSDEVRSLCLELTLPENKIKIWFQNRRAREKRKSSQSSDEYVDVMTIDGENS